MASVTARLSDRLEVLADAARSRFATPGRRTRTSVVLGRILGVLLIVCFLTGLYSHLLQHPIAGWPAWPRPVWLYRLTQGTHVIVGLALIPVLLGKLWSVFPRLFSWPPVTGVRSLVERASIAVLVSTALVEVTIGAMNIAQWYAFGFSFPRVHFALAWVLIGSVLLHVAVKLPTMAAFWRAPRGAPVARRASRPLTWPEQPDPDPDEPETVAERVSRRGALAAIGAASGVIVLTTAGQSVTPLAPIAFLSPRRPFVGPQGLPVNRTAQEAGVLESAPDAGWRLQVVGSRRRVELSLAELRGLTAHTATLPIACVEGWSQDAAWTGAPFSALLALVDEDPTDLRLTSLQTRGGYAVTEMPAAYVADPDTLAAYELGGKTLALDHGYPLRAIAPGRPGVLQTKWLSRIEVLS